MVLSQSHTGSSSCEHVSPQLRTNVALTKVVLLMSSSPSTHVIMPSGSRVRLPLDFSELVDVVTAQDGSLESRLAQDLLFEPRVASGDADSGDTGADSKASVESEEEECDWCADTDYPSGCYNTNLGRVVVTFYDTIHNRSITRHDMVCAHCRDDNFGRAPTTKRHGGPVIKHRPE